MKRRACLMHTGFVCILHRLFVLCLLDLWDMFWIWEESWKAPISYQECILLCGYFQMRKKKRILYIQHNFLQPFCGLHSTDVSKTLYLRHFVLVSIALTPFIGLCNPFISLNPEVLAMPVVVNSFSLMCSYLLMPIKTKMSNSIYHDIDSVLTYTFPVDRTPFQTQK